MTPEIEIIAGRIPMRKKYPQAFDFAVEMMVMKSSRKGWHPSKNADHDYDVLLKVQSKWNCDDRDDFAVVMGNILCQFGINDWPYKIGNYTPGDFAEAALMVRLAELEHAGCGGMETQQITAAG